MNNCIYCNQQPVCYEDPDHSTAWVISHSCSGVRGDQWLWGQWKDLVVKEWNRDNEDD